MNNLLCLCAHIVFFNAVRPSCVLELTVLGKIKKGARAASFLVARQPGITESEILQCRLVFYLATA
jgi:hypothetical protein